MARQIRCGPREGPKQKSPPGGTGGLVVFEYPGSLSAAPADAPRASASKSPSAIGARRGAQFGAGDGQCRTGHGPIPCSSARMARPIKNPGGSGLPGSSDAWEAVRLLEIERRIRSRYNKARHRLLPPYRALLVSGPRSSCSSIKTRLPFSPAQHSLQVIAHPSFLRRKASRGAPLSGRGRYHRERRGTWHAAYG